MNTVDIYKENQGEKEIEEFVIEYRPLVKKIALYIKRRLPSHIEFDDLLQSGLIGLIEARNNYKENMGATFETFASIRIKGAILDSLRKNSWISRETLKNMRLISETISRLEQRFQRHATSEEIASELGITPEEHFKISQEISICNVLSLDELDQEGDYISGEGDKPEEIVSNEIDRKLLKSLLEKLPHNEKMVLSLYYIEEFTFKQIGEILDLTEARICQLHSQSIARIKSRVSPDKSK